jgi:hypothetical protein
MERITVFLIFSTFSFGIVVGFYITNFLQNQLEVLIPVSVALAFFTWLGSGADFVGILRDLYKERREKAKIPIFEPKGFYKNSQNAYFLRIQKVKGEDIGDKAIGYYTVEGTSFQAVPTVWEFDALREIDIPSIAGLRLFRVWEKDSIFFPSAGEHKDFAENEIQYNEAINKELSIEIYFRYGQIKQPITKKISDIINETH